MISTSADHVVHVNIQCPKSLERTEIVATKLILFKGRQVQSFQVNDFYFVFNELNQVASRSY